MPLMFFFGWHASVILRWHVRGSSNIVFTTNELFVFSFVVSRYVMCLITRRSLYASVTRLSSVLLSMLCSVSSYVRCVTRMYATPRMRSYAKAQSCSKQFRQRVFGLVLAPLMPKTWKNSHYPNLKPPTLKIIIDWKTWKNGHLRSNFGSNGSDSG